MDKINWEQEYYKAVAKIEGLKAELKIANEEKEELIEELAHVLTPNMEEIELVKTNKALRNAIKALMEVL